MNYFIDMHCDTNMCLLYHPDFHLKDSDMMINLNKLMKSEYLLQCFACFVPYISPEQEENYSSFKVCQQMIDRYYQEIDKNKDIIAPVYQYQDIENNLKQGKISSLLTIEEGGVIEGHIEYLRNFYRLGVRMMTLTWNFKNEIASPNIDYFKVPKDKHPDFKIPNTEDGLSEFGKEVVKEMNRLGMVIDLSHASDKTFYDVIALSRKPVVCSHSNARSVCHHVRNLTDDMLLKLKDNGGVVGINFCHDFVTDQHDIATIKDIVDHIDYIKNLIGIDFIGLGSDFDGISNKDIEIKDATYMPLIIDELYHRNYTKEEVDKITHKNVLRVFKNNF